MIRFRSVFLASIIIYSVLLNTSFAFDGGSGDLGNPFQIATPEHLISIGSNPDFLDKHYIMVADVNMAEYTFTTAVIAPDIDESYLFKGTAFTGTFNGNGFKIYNLVIDTLSDGDPENDSNSFLGLFGKIDINGEVNDLKVENVNINCNGPSRYIGGLAGWCSGTLIDCYTSSRINSTGINVGGLTGFSGNRSYEDRGRIINCSSSSDVRGSDQVGGLTGLIAYDNILNCHSSGSVYGEQFVGGLVGYNEDAILFSCYSNSDATGTGDFVGGLVGYSLFMIRYCYSTGSVKGINGIGGLVGSNCDELIYCYSTSSVEGSWSVGGLVGENVYGDIKNCYSISSVNGNRYTGGLVGYHWYSTIMNCFSAGKVEGGSNKGGLVGYKEEEGDIVNSFWDIESSGITYSHGGIGKKTSEMKDNSTFIGSNWDFAGIDQDGDAADWQIGLGNYPNLQWEQVIPTFQYDSGDGSSENPYQISTAEQLISIGSIPNLMNKHFILTSDIDMSSYSPSCSVIASPNHFIGVFNGNGYKIINLTMDTLFDCNPESEYGYNLGLFGFVDGRGHIKNLGVENVSIIGKQASCVGAIIGIMYSNAIITNSYTTGYVEGSAVVGGLVGLIDLTSKVFNCYSSCNVKGNSSVGGIVGYNYEGVLNNCYSIGLIIGGNKIGGLVGTIGYIDEDNRGTVINCYSTGIVTGDQSVGGLIGLSNLCMVDNCYSTGPVIGTEDYIGGLIGRYRQGTISENCFWDIEVSGQVTSAGGIGKTTVEMKTMSKFVDAGWDFEGDWWINDGRDYPRLSWQPFGDLNNDSRVNTTDLAIMSANWTMDINDEGVDRRCELSGDNNIDAEDLTNMIDMWLAGPKFND